MAIEQLYSLQAAVEIIPMVSAAALSQFLSKNKAHFPRPRYKRIGGPKVRQGGYEIRMLTETEVLKIREMTLMDETTSRYHKSEKHGRPRKQRGLIDSIIARAMA